MSKELTLHKVKDVPCGLTIKIVDERGAEDGASHRYEVVGFDTDKNPAAVGANGFKEVQRQLIVVFQQGPLNEIVNGERKPITANGVSPEALLAILVEHLTGLQSGPGKTEKRGVALKHLQEALVEMRSLVWRTRQTAVAAEKTDEEKLIEAAAKPAA